MRREERRREERKQFMTPDNTGKVTEMSKSVFKCDQCDTISKSEKGLKMHMSRTHKTSTETPVKLRHNFLSTSLLLTPSKEERQEMCPNCDQLMSPGHLCDASETEDEDETSDTISQSFEEKKQAFKVISQHEGENITACKGREGHRKIHCFDSEFQEGPCEFKCSCKELCKIQCYCTDCFNTLKPLNKFTVYHF